MKRSGKLLSIHMDLAHGFTVAKADNRSIVSLSKVVVEIKEVARPKAWKLHTSCDVGVATFGGINQYVINLEDQFESILAGCYIPLLQRDLKDLFLWQNKLKLLEKLENGMVFTPTQSFINIEHAETRFWKAGPALPVRMVA